MKPLIFLPLLGFLINTSAIDTEFKMTKKDTVYEYVKSDPHHCELRDVLQKEI